MCQDWYRDFMDVFQTDHVAAMQSGTRLRPQNQILNGTRTGSPGNERLQPGWSRASLWTSLANQSSCVLVNMIRHGNSTHQVLVLNDLGSGDQMFQLRQYLASRRPGDQYFFLFRRIIQLDQKHKSVELRFGKRISSFLFHGVLSGKYEKRWLQLKRFSNDSDLLLLHCFQHCSLRFRGGTVDFVRQHDVRENRTTDELKFTSTVGTVLQDVGPGDVHGHQIGCELDTTEAQRHRF